MSGKPVKFFDSASHPAIIRSRELLAFLEQKYTIGSIARVIEELEDIAQNVVESFAKGWTVSTGVAICMRRALEMITEQPQAYPKLILKDILQQLQITSPPEPQKEPPATETSQPKGPSKKRKYARRLPPRSSPSASQTNSQELDNSQLRQMLRIWGIK